MYYEWFLCNLGKPAEKSWLTFLGKNCCFMKLWIFAPKTQLLVLLRKGLYSNFTKSSNVKSISLLWIDSNNSRSSELNSYLFQFPFPSGTIWVVLRIICRWPFPLLHERSAPPRNFGDMKVAPAKRLVDRQGCKMISRQKHGERV